jgi:hypothetical protein
VAYRAARGALDLFLNPPAPGQRLAVVTGPDDAASLPAVIEVTDIRHLATGPMSGGRRHQTSFHVKSPLRDRPILIVFNHTSDGPRTNAAIFLQQWEGRVEKFLETRDAPPHRFFLVLDLAHSFEVEAPDSSRFHCFSLQSPAGEDLHTRVYASRSSPEGAALEHRMHWGQPHRAYVELTWSPARPDAGAPKPFLRLSDVTDDSW